MQKFIFQITVTGNVEEVALKWSHLEISFIQSQKGRDIKVNNCVFVIGFGSEAVEVTYQDH